MPLDTNQNLSLEITEIMLLDDESLQLFAPSLIDYAELTKPHVEAVRAVLHGERFRYKLGYENAVLLFDHGCLMGRIYYQGRFFSLPPLVEELDRTVSLRVLPFAQKFAVSEFCTLPKGVLLFYFSLLKQVFEGRTLVCRKWTASGYDLKSAPIPAPLRPWLEAVGWPYASSEFATGCKAS